MIMFEFQQLLQAAIALEQKSLKAVLATVVTLQGSSYRRPGVRMLIGEDGSSSGAVSGGCVEKEIIRSSRKVFETGIPRMITYDGRYRLGCEGILHILLEPFEPSAELTHLVREARVQRASLAIRSCFEECEGVNSQWGSEVQFGNRNLPLRKDFSTKSSVWEKGLLEQLLPPPFRLLIAGAEHDAADLCGRASSLGWEVWVLAPADDSRTRGNFPGAYEVLNTTPDLLDISLIDETTAVMLMSHSYSTDLKYLLALMGLPMAYLGILGPVKRRESLFHEVMERRPDLDPESFHDICAPAGLQLGAETAQEISISILAEIMAVTRKQPAVSLRKLNGPIHGFARDDKA